MWSGSEWESRGQLKLLGLGGSWQGSGLEEPICFHWESSESNLLEVVRLWYPSESFMYKSWGAKKMGSPAWCPTFSSSPKLGVGMAILEWECSTGFIQLVRHAAGMWMWKKVPGGQKATSEYHRLSKFSVFVWWSEGSHSALRSMPAFQHCAKLCPWLLPWFTKPVTGSPRLPQWL